jgi:hypothetical protein
MGEKKNVYMLVVGKPDGKRPLRRRSHKRVCNIKIGLAILGSGGKDCIGLAHGTDQWWALGHTVMHFQFR